MPAVARNSAQGGLRLWRTGRQSRIVFVRVNDLQEPFVLLFVLLSLLKPAGL